MEKQMEIILVKENEVKKTIELTFENDFSFLEGKDGLVTLVDTKGNKLEIESHYYQDCCEYNYIDGGNLGDTLITEMKSNKLLIEFIDDYGIRINGNGIPCYSEQNGHYSNEILLEFEYISVDGKYKTLTRNNVDCEVV